MLVLIIFWAPGMQLVDEGVHNNASVLKMIHKLCQKQSGSKLGHTIKLAFLPVFSYDRVLQVFFYDV